MKLELERLGETPESYRVKPAGEETFVGVVTRTGPAAWEFSPQGADAKPDDAMTIVLRAETLDEVKAAIEKRFTTDTTLDRLADSTLEQFATRVMLPISSLATSTKSIMGLVNALGHQVAVIASHDIVPDKREEFFTQFIERVRSETQGIVRDRENREAWERMMRGLMAVAVADAKADKGEGDGPTKH